MDDGRSDGYAIRKRLRLLQYDYGASGAYFVTICTKGRHNFFENDELKNILEMQWRELVEHFAGIELDVFMVMPDHVHFVVWINSKIEGLSCLPDLVKRYKSLVSVAWIRYMQQSGTKGTGKIWQVSYHDHIIRNELDLDEKREYILNNPIKG